MKKRRPLLLKYVGIVCLYFLLFPAIFVLLQLLQLAYLSVANVWDEVLPKYETVRIENSWHEFANEMSTWSDDEKRTQLRLFHESYPESTIFWVDAAGQTQFKIPEDAAVPDDWSITKSIDFIKTYRGADPFTVVALSNESDIGFIVFQISREYTDFQRTDILYYINFPIIVMLAIGLFILLSWLFFNRIRKRLVQLQQAMHEAQQTSRFRKVIEMSNDEITDLERSFNLMAEQLMNSRERELKEEQLRRELIANISHDLRTPLTIMRSQTYTLERESLSEQGRHALSVVNEKIEFVDQLIDNLLSYTLLSAGKYPFERQKTNINRLLKEITASWYPVFEENEFTIQIDLPDQPIYWNADPHWFKRIWDNLLQNVIRHAASGKYIRLRAQRQNDAYYIILEDRGPGMNAESERTGAGIGLSIVSLMCREMNIDWSVESSSEGTKHTLKQQPNLFLSEN